jgi:nucleoside triphosphatase
MSEQNYPELTVGAFIFDQDGRLLLLQSHKWPGRYVVPGGHVELGETIEGAVRREAREETGLDVRELRFLCWQEFIYDPSFWKPRHFIFFDYTCRTESTEVV